MNKHRTEWKKGNTNCKFFLNQVNFFVKLISPSHLPLWTRSPLSNQDPGAFSSGAYIGNLSAPCKATGIFFNGQDGKHQEIYISKLKTDTSH